MVIVQWSIYIYIPLDLVVIPKEAGLHGVTEDHRLLAFLEIFCMDWWMEIPTIQSYYIIC